MKPTSQRARRTKAVRGTPKPKTSGQLLIIGTQQYEGVVKHSMIEPRGFLGRLMHLIEFSHGSTLVAVSDKDENIDFRPMK